MENEALEQIEQNPHWLEQKALCLLGDDWNEGLIGIVAGRIAERFHKPTLCLARNGDTAKGSARSIEGFDLYRALSDVQAKDGIFGAFGGHSAAAGFSLPLSHVGKLRNAFWTAGEEWWDDEASDASYIVDAPINLHQLTISLLDGLKRLEPFGQGNPDLSCTSLMQEWLR
ncbi:DHHA1 domain-containing protein [Alicyclobacillus dauci]